MQDRYYELLPGLPIRVEGTAPLALRDKIERELAFYRSDSRAAPSEPVLVVSGETERPVLVGAPRLEKAGLFFDRQQDTVILKLGQGQMLVRGLSDMDVPIRLSCYGAVPARKAWRYLENIYKHLCLLLNRAVFIHGCGVVVNGKPLFLVGWSGSGKTHFLINVLKQGGAFFAEDFIILDANGYVWPYVPACFDFGYYHILRSGLLARLSRRDRQKISVVAAVDRVLPFLPSKLVCRVVEHFVKGLRFYHLDWRNVFPKVEYALDPVEAVSTSWRIIQNIDSSDMEHMSITHEIATARMAAAASSEMGIYLNVLWQIQFLDKRQECRYPGAVIEAVNQVVSDGLATCTDLAALRALPVAIKGWQ